MKEQLEQKLYDEFPSLFSGEDREVFCGFQCHDGWFALIRELCEKIVAVMVKKSPGDYDPEVLEVKEKMGELRFHMVLAPDEVYDLIERFEKKSSTICEICGKPGKTIAKPKTYKLTRCPDHLGD